MDTVELDNLNVSGVSTFQGNVHLGDDDKTPDLVIVKTIQIYP